VTHNKGTMSACRMLYGITMQTKGVSRNVSVELSDVDQFVPEVTGDADKAQASRRDAAEAGVAVEEGDLDADGQDDSPSEPIVELQPHAKHAAGAGPSAEPQGDGETAPVDSESAASAS
jgi:hypothetical protein